MDEEFTELDKINICFAINAYLITRNVDYAVHPTMNRRLELDMFENLLEKVNRSKIYHKPQGDQTIFGYGDMKTETSDGWSGGK